MKTSIIMETTSRHIDGPVIQVVFLDKSVVFLYSTLTVDNLKLVFNVKSLSYLEDSKGNRFYPMIDKYFEDIASKKVFLRQEIPKIPQVKIYPTETKFLFSNASWYASSEVYVGYSTKNQNMRITVIHFQDLSSLEKNKSISKVYLRLIGNNFQENYEPVEVFVHRVDEPWSNITTWQQVPIYRAEPYSSIIVRTGSEVPFFWDVTGIVVDWVTNSFPNYGIVLKTDDVYGIGSVRGFHGNDPVKKPCLLVYYDED